MQNVTHVLTNEQSELRADTAEASRRRLNARANIGLDQVDNTSDADKPISSATQDALDSKMDVDNGTYLKSAEVSGNGYTLTIRPNNGDVIEFQGGGIVETVQADWAENSPSDPSFIKNKPDLSGFATTSSMDTALEQKQDTIDDLNTIRSGAAAGATAVQPSVLDDYATTSDLATGLAGKQETIDDLSTIREGASAGATAVQPAALSAYATTSDVSNALADKQDVISDLSTIREGASSGATAVQPESLATVATTGNYEDLNDSPDMSTYATTNALNDAISGIRQVPVSEPADLNKVLTVNGSGTPVWAPAQGGGGGGASVNDVTVNGTSVVDSNGVGVVIVPTKTSDLQNDSGFITSVPVTGVEVDGTSVVNGQGVAEINLPAQAQANWDESDSSDPSYIQNKPTIPAAQVNADWTASSGVAQILNKPSIPLATSDLTNDSGFITTSDVPAAQEQADWNESDTTDPAYIKNKPTIPAAQVNADWTASSGVAEILHKPSIPSATSDLTNDSGFITASDVPSAQAQADWDESDSSDPSYIKNKPTIPAAQVNSDWNASSGVAQILNKPSIPTATSDLTNDSGFITSSDIPAQAQANWNEMDTSDPSYIQNKPTIPAAQVNSDWTASSGVAEILHKPNIPSATSDLTNDSGFITSSDVPAAQEQADWNESDTTDPAYIKNKPTIPAAQVNADWNSSTGVSKILNKPSIPTNTSDLNNDSGFITVSDIPAQAQADWTEWDNTKASFVKNKPTLATVATSGSYGDLSNAPTLASVATSGDYDDLTNKPTIPAAQVNSDWDAVSGVAKILNKPSLATVATTGSYDDLIDKPTIPTVPVTDVTVNGSSVVSNGTAAVVVPAQAQADWTETDNTKASFVKNKPSLATVATTGSYSDLSNTPTLATVATTGSYDDLIDKPTIPTVPVTDVTVNGSSVVSNGTAAVVVPAQAQADWTESDNTKPSFVKNKPSLATVATTGSYTDLSNTPTIPSVPVTDVTVDGTSVLSNGTAAVVIPVKDVTVGGSSVVTNQGVAAITIPTQVQADWTESDNSDPSFIANKPDLTVKADKVTSATSGDFAALDSNGNLTDSGVSANSFKTVQNAVNDPTASGTATSFIDSISQNSNGVITATKKTIPQDLISRTVYVGQDCVYNDKEFWGNASTVADVIDDYANQTVTDYRGNSVSLVRFQAEYDSNRYRIAEIDETPGTVDYNRKIGGQIVDLMRSDYGMSSHSGYDILKFDDDMAGLFDLLMSGSPMHAYLSLHDMNATTFLTTARREMYMDMIKAYDAWPYADKDTAYSDFMNEHSLDRFVQVATSWPLNDWSSYRYVMAGTKTATDKMIFVIRHAERGDDTSVNGDINSTGVTTCTTMGEQARNNASWTNTSNNVTYKIDNFLANDATYYSTEYLRCKHSAQAFAAARYDTDFAASDYSGVTVEAELLYQYRFFYQPASSGNSSLIRKYSVNPSQLTSTELQTNFGVSTASEAETKLTNDYVRVCKEILNKSTARLNMFYTHDYFTLPLAVMASNKAITFSSSDSNWINYCAGIGMILHPDNTYEVMPVRGKSSGTMSI